MWLLASNLIIVIVPSFRDLTSWYPLTNCSGEVEPCNEYQNSLDVTVKKHEVVISEAYMIVPEDATADDIQLMEYEAEWVSW